MAHRGLIWILILKRHRSSFEGRPFGDRIGESRGSNVNNEYDICIATAEDIPELLALPAENQDGAQHQSQTPFQDFRAGVNAVQHPEAVALRRGLVSEVVPGDQLETRVLEFCEAVASQAPLAVRRTKHLVARTPLVTDVDARMVDEIRRAAAGLNSEDGQEAVRAIMEKRAPKFTGH